MQRQVYGEPAENWIIHRDLDWREVAAITEFVFRRALLLPVSQPAKPCIHSTYVSKLFQILTCSPIDANYYHQSQFHVIHIGYNYQSNSNIKLSKKPFSPDPFIRIFRISLNRELLSPCIE